MRPSVPRSHALGRSVALLALAAGLTACGGGSGDDDAAAGGGATAPSTDRLGATCAPLAGTPVRGGSVATAELVAATPAPITAASLPAHCLLRGKMNERVGIDGRPYALQFELRLPLAWNSRFFYQGGSGVDGTLFTATGAYGGGGNTRNALLDGYAVVTTDSGHLAVPGAANGAFLFGADPQARLEYGNTQIPQVTAAARTVIDRFYGAAPRRSYFVGCSNGGRQAMIAAQQYPELFDGIVAAAPGFRLAQASIQALYQAQRTAAVAPLGSDGRPDITQGLSGAEQATVRQRILAACDALDGATDGMVSRPSACRPDPATWACQPGESAGSCLTPAKAAYVKDMFAGARTRAGEAIYAAWPYDPGMTAQFANPFYSLFAGEASHVYTSPPTVTTDLLGYGLGADIDAEYAKLFAVSGLYTPSGVAFTNAESPDMDAFRARNGKLIIYNGTADLAFSIRDVERYYRQLQARYGDAATADFTRAFFVPGMGHCSGGSAGTDQFDAFGALVDWVERGRAPDVMISTARAAAGVPWPGRTRPLCAYPREAVYDGSGSIEDAASFSCR